MPQQPAAGFAGLLRQLRTKAGLTQEELAAAAGVSTRAISDLERGVNQSARKDTADLLADGMKLTGSERERFLLVARGKPDPEPTARAAAAASNMVWIESALSSTFVGRERELGTLRGAWSEALAGHRVLALVGGEPGIGKTALVAELARQVRADGGLVLYGRWDEHVLAPYQAFREALSDYSRACPEAVLHKDRAGLTGEIARLYPVPAQRPGEPAARPALPAADAERFRLFESLDTWIGRMAARHPVLLVLDDLQWADQSSLLLLPHLMRAKRSTPLLVAAMYRDTLPERGSLEATLPSLTRDINCRRLTLRGLEHDAVTALLESSAGRPFGQRESPVVADLERETAGNPFFLLEMARHLAEGGMLFPDTAGPGPRAGAVPGTPAGIPESVRDMVRSRLRRLSAGCAELLTIASLIGDRFDAALLAAAASLDETVTLEFLEEAERAGLVSEIDAAETGFAGAGEDAGGELDRELDHWRFAHSLTRRVTSEELSRSRRVRLHHRIGETLETRPGVSPARLAHHFTAAGRSGAGQAVGYERLAGERALAEVAAEVAVSHFRSALELIDRFGTGGPPLRCEVLLELAGAEDRAGKYASRDDRYAEAADLARDLGDDGLFVQAALRYGGVLPSAVHPDPRAQALLTEALDRLSGAAGDAAADDAGDGAARAMVLARLAHWQHTARPYPERLALSDQAVAMARGAGDRPTLAAVLLHRCLALDGPRDVDDALGVSAEIIGIAGELGDSEFTLEGLRVRLAAQFEKGQHAAAAATARDLKQRAEQAGHPEFIRLAAMWDVTVANLEGRFADAEKLAGELARRLERLGHPQAEGITMVQTFQRRWLQGQASEYIPVFETLSSSDPGNHAWPAVTAWCLAEAGARRRAAALLREVGPSAAEADDNYHWWAVLVGLSVAACRTSDARQARVLYGLAAPYAGNNATLGAAAFLGAADHWLGVLAGTAGRHDEAAAHLDAALARHQEMGARPWTALTQDAYASVLTARGHDAKDAEYADTLRRSALRTADELGLAVITGPRD